MATTVFENTTNRTYAPPQEDAALHNALIGERYKQLQSAEENQLAKSISKAEETPYAQAYASATPVAERSAPTEQANPVSGNRAAFSSAAFAPSAPEFTHTRTDSALFTPETLDKTIGRTLERNVYAYPPETAAPAIPTETAGYEENLRQTDAAEIAYAGNPALAVGVEAGIRTGSAASEESYALSSLAIKMIAAFAALMVLLLAIIGINSSLIRQKTTRLNALTERKTELVAEDELLRQRIEQAKSYESILKFAQENGMILSDK